MTNMPNSNSGAASFGPAGKSPAVSAASLPPDLRCLVDRVLKKSRLWRCERSDVEAELAAHFADGLASGAAPAQLAIDFGNPASAAKLIRRGKLRNRPRWWHALNRARQAAVLGVVALLLFVGIHAIRFYIGQPTLRFNPVEVMNRESIAIPESSRAWPLYRQAILSLDLNDAERNLLADSLKNLPSDAEFAQIKPLLERSRRSLELTRQGASRPALGYIAGHTTDHELDMKAWEVGGKKGLAPVAHPSETSEENRDAISILLTHFSPMRQLVRLLRADSYAAIHEEDSRRLTENVTAILAMSVQARSPDAIISRLVSIAFLNVAGEVLRDALAAQPDLLSDSQLRDLAHRFASMGSAADLVSLQGERIFFDDFLQRTYTDDGNGDGRFTAEGARYLAALADPSDPVAPPVYAVSSIVLANRKDLHDVYHGALDRAQAELRVPPWQLPESSERAGASFERSLETPLARVKYEAISILMPALSRVYTVATNAVLERDATLTAIAIELYRRNYRSLPTSLDALVPSYLPAIPLDNADGKPLRFVLCEGGYVLYSLGADRQDAGGVSAQNQRDQTLLRQFGRTSEPTQPADWVLFPREHPLAR
ncbi:MAG: hypothetical protein KF805_06895 [Phycisphaeraceae bacterium]|nr:hypothetical protein [Phycisphaeraceae bacterium]